MTDQEALQDAITSVLGSDDASELQAMGDLEIADEGDLLDGDEEEILKDVEPPKVAPSEIIVYDHISMF